MISLLQDSIIHQADAAPEKEAFRCRSDSLTYGRLVERAAQLANVLRKRGVSSMDRVGIYMGKSIELPISTYGILMAGAAYVPIDPNAPQDRVEFAIKDCGIDVVVTNKSKLRAMAKIVASGKAKLKHIVGIDPGEIEGVETSSWESIWLESTSIPEIDTREDDLAYVMYTSGSTGTPKGLMHTHRSGLAYARYSADLYSVGPRDVLGNHAPLHFDISTFEYLTGPYAGATSVLIPEEQIMFPVSLARFIEEERLTFFYSVPLALIQLLNGAGLSQQDLSSLRWVLFGGEPFPPKYLELLVKAIPSARFCNVYGPAEVNQCTYYHLPEDYTDDGEPVPIGATWKGARGLLVDEDDRPVSEGAIGELLVASATMMQGYWNRTDLNRKAFYIEESLPGFKRRYYRTGDLVRRDEHGALHFQGRKDRQVKVRGNRLELEEVESALAAQAQVEEAAAILGTSQDVEGTLLAIVTLREGCEFDERQLREGVRSKLPTYGVPQRFIVLETFPRTASGKIDRTQLKSEYGNIDPVEV